MINLCNNKRIDMLKLGCTLPNLANLCLHSSMSAMFFPFPEGDKDLLEKVGENLLEGPPIVFTRKTLVGETKIRSSPNICKSSVGFDASQLYPCAMRQAMPSGLHRGRSFEVHLQRLKPRSSKANCFQIMVKAFFQSSHSDCKIDRLNTTGADRKSIVSALTDFVVTVTSS